MKLTIAYKKMKHSENVDRKIKEKLERLERHFGPTTNIHWTCSMKGFKYTSHVDITSPHHSFHAEAVAENLYKTFDMAVDKLDKQLMKTKIKVNNKMHRDYKEAVILDPEMAWAEHDENRYDDVA